jgi:alanyl-tRNA synthetase
MSAPSSAAEIREAFLQFFEARGHRRVPSASLIPTNDPTLLFTVAGMVPFKDVFTGNEIRDYRRATSAQKCVRAGGKQNDLDNVGFTARHHTFFEMLGNFSFGDYFKADAIAWAWELVTRVLELPKERLAVTVFKGEEGIPADEEAYELWLKQGVSKDRIRRLGLKDNFWAAGDVGPCGPCSEIYFYLPDQPVKEDELPGDSDNWLEIWNLVFMQFERKEGSTLLHPLPRPSIDTGGGLERMASVVQRKQSNYDTDLFVPLLQKIAGLSKKKYGANSADDASMRVVADHARAAAFLIADGVQPSNEKRGYVLRRIMRRAIRHGSKLGLDDLFFDQVVAAVIEQMGGVYPELNEGRAFVLEVTRQEEESFRRTLDRGLKRIDEETERLKGSGGKVISGDVVFLLHDTHGFPWDLTQVIAQERGLDIDLPGYQAKMATQREQGSFGGSGEKAVSEVWQQLAAKLPATQFTGYEATRGTGTVLALVQKGTPVQSAKAGSEVELVLDSTPFYAESGGQVGDTGELSTGKLELQVLDTIKPVPTLHVHKTKVVSGEIKVADALQLQVDVQRRNAIRANHSATHLLHRALKIVLGDAVKQAGSVVQPDYLRFDYSCFAAPTPEQLEKVEDLVNGWIRENAPSQTQVMALDEAKASGAIAMFGEKYGERVRVVSVHPQSTELCGGTHAHATGDLGLFKITQESSIASGVRRIVALTGAGAFGWLRELDKELKRAAEVLKAPPREVVKRIESLQARIKEQDGELKRAQLKAQTGGGAASFTEKTVGSVKVRTQQVSAPCDANVMRELADRYRDQLGSGIVGLGGETADGKALILVAATKDLVAKGFKAGDAVRVMAETVGGKGGGKPELAQAGGTEPSKIPAALERLFELVKI